MKQVQLPHGRATTQLGFGCTVLRGGSGGDQNRAVLEAAYAAGIRHFDVAPSYGLGVAEGILGGFLADKRSDVTVTTKVGLPRPSNSGMLAKLRSVVRPLVANNPELRRMIGGSVQKMSGAGTVQFDMPHVRQSVDESLRELKTDYVDILLLHEITPAEVTDELQQFLDDAVKAGKVLSYGIGSYRSEAEAIVRECPQLCAMVQTSWAVGDRELNFSSHTPLVSTHGAVRNLSRTQERISSKPDKAAALSQALNTDLKDSAQLASLMIAAAFAHNPDGLILVSTTKADRVEMNCKIAEDIDRQERGKQLHEALLADW